MDPESTLLSELRYRQILYDLSYMWNLKKKIFFFFKPQLHRYREMIGGCQRKGVQDGRNA